MDRCSNSGKSSQRRERVRRERVSRKKISRTKIKVREKVFGSGGSKSRLAKETGAEPSWKMRDEQLHAAVARGKFRSHNVKKNFSVEALLEVETFKTCTPLGHEAHLEVTMLKRTSASEHFWKLRRSKRARRWGTKHMWKSQCKKNFSVGALLEVEAFKPCTTLGHEAHLEVTTLKRTSVSEHFWKLRRSNRARRWGTKHIWKSQC